MTHRRVSYTYSVTPEFRDAVREYCREHGLNHSEEVRRFWARKMKQASLVDANPIGRPRKKTE